MWEEKQRWRKRRGQHAAAPPCVEIFTGNAENGAAKPDLGGETRGTRTFTDGVDRTKASIRVWLTVPDSSFLT